MTQEEQKALDDVNTPHGKWWAPIVWICNLLKECKNEGRISDDFMLKALYEVRTV